jgi:GxxExxY protein
MGMRHSDASEYDQLTEAVIGAAIEVHRELGAGLLERSYEIALTHELGLRNIPFRTQVEICPRYKSVSLAPQRLDLLVGDTLVVELMSVESVSDAHLAQLVSYLTAGAYPIGLLLNFRVPVLRNGIYRRVNTQVPIPNNTLRVPSAPPRT